MRARLALGQTIDHATRPLVSISLFYDKTQVDNSKRCCTPPHPKFRSCHKQVPAKRLPPDTCYDCRTMLPVFIAPMNIEEKFRQHGIQLLCMVPDHVTWIDAHLPHTSETVSRADIEEAYERTRVAMWQQILAPIHAATQPENGVRATCIIRAKCDVGPTCVTVGRRELVTSQANSAVAWPCSVLCAATD